MELKLISSVLLFSLWSVVMSAKAFATADDPMLKEIFTEVLGDNDDERAIFTCKIIDAHRVGDFGVRHVALVTEAFRGVSADTVILSMVEHNCVRGTQESTLAIGSEHLVVSKGCNNNFLYDIANHCIVLKDDLFMKAKNVDTIGPSKVELARDHFLKVAEKYSGPIEYHTKYIRTKGQLLNGVSDGKWTHSFIYHDTLVTTTHYHRGRRHGLRYKKFYNNYGGRRSGIIEKYEEGELVYSESSQGRYSKHREERHYTRTGIEQQVHRIKKETKSGRIVAEQKEIIANLFTYHLALDGRYYSNESLTDNCEVSVVGLYHRGARVGVWTYCTNSEETVDSVVSYPSPQPSSFDYSLYHDNGVIAIEGDLQEGLPQGKWTHYNEDGKVLNTVQYDMGLYSGTIRYPDSSAEYVDSKRHGLSKAYSYDGQLIELSEYKEGVRDGWVREYYESGQLHSEVEYDHGVRTGQSSHYDDSGNLAELYNYDNKGVLSGCYQKFQSGSPVEEGQYANGYKTGLWKYHRRDKKGNIVLREGHYIKGFKAGIWKVYSQGKVKEESYPEDPQKAIKTYFSY